MSTIKTRLLPIFMGAALLTLTFSSARADAMPTTDPVVFLDAAPIDGKININEATETQWALLPGIGPSTAKKLVDYRAKRKFTALNQVMRVKGIGSKTYQRIKPFLSLEGETTLSKGKKSDRAPVPGRFGGGR